MLLLDSWNHYFCGNIQKSFSSLCCFYNLLLVLKAFGWKLFWC
ncbi:hypothetical protein RchiOBHm_Chr2g0155391 [Rosa chinensis]|uniref:Uncharacterized protein n=1 Tax=Rosa chinensis TaxID=74649 RepID=A0A2P6S162_ROSCH|nr:hypothetical protein RchiOBHm_Chr2g0155391 [Rosa chinensis]